MDISTIYLFIETFGIFSCAVETTQTTRPIIIARNNNEIIAVRVLDFGPMTTNGGSEAPLYRQPSLEKITLKDIKEGATLSEAREILQKMDEENIFFSHKSF